MQIFVFLWLLLIFLWYSWVFWGTGLILRNPLNSSSRMFLFLHLFRKKVFLDVLIWVGSYSLSGIEILHVLLSFRVCVWKFTVILMGLPLCMIFKFSLTIFKIPRFWDTWHFNYNMLWGASYFIVFGWWYINFTSLYVEFFFHCWEVFIMLL